VKRRRVPGTRSATWRREVACGGDPVGAVVAACGEFRPFRRGDEWSIDVAHDDSCPALDGAGMPACTCEIIQLAARRAA
jgi:hypothetical protein